MDNSLKDKRVFVSGGAGVIGRYVVGELEKLGAQVFVGDLKPKPAEFSSSVIYRCGNLNYMERGWIEDFDPQVFIHLAATFERTQESEQFFHENHHHNINLGHYLLDLMMGGTSLESTIFASSYLVYDSDLYIKEGKSDPYVLREDSAINTRNLVGAAKLYHEGELDFVKRKKGEDFQAVNARIFRSFGCGSRDVISRWVRSAIVGEAIEVYDQDGSFDYIDAQDVAKGLVALASNQGCSGVYNIGSGKSTKISEVVECLQDVFPGVEVRFKEGSGQLESSQACIEKMNTEANWKPECDLRSSIERIAQYEKGRGELDDIEGSILVTSVSKKVPLIKAIKSAVRKLGSRIDVIGADVDSRAIGLGFVDMSWVCPRHEECTFDGYMEFCKEHEVRMIVPTRDEELAFFAKNRKRFQEAGVAVMVSEQDAIDLCSDKLGFYRELEGCGVIETARSIEGLKADCGSYVVKERMGSGSKGIQVQCSKDEAQTFSLSLKDPVFQPYVEGREFSVDFYVDKEGRLKGSVSRWREVIVGGESQVTQMFFSEKVDQLVKNLCSKVRFYGHCVLQGIEDGDGQLHLIEVNPRFGGASTLGVAGGVDSFYWFLLEAIGVDISEYPFVRAKEALKLVRYPEDSIVSSNRDLKASSLSMGTPSETALSYLDPADSPVRT